MSNDEPVEEAALAPGATGTHAHAAAVEHDDGDEGDDDNQDEEDCKEKGSSKDPSSSFTLIKELSPTDVLMGRGGPAIQHPGNVRFRHIVNTRKAEYAATKKRRMKDWIARQVMHAVLKQGRFVRKLEPAEAKSSEEAQNTWVAVEDSVVMQKVKQALRDRDAFQQEERKQKQKNLRGDTHKPEVASEGQGQKRKASFSIEKQDSSKGPLLETASNKKHGPSSRGSYFPHLSSDRTPASLRDKSENQIDAKSVEVAKAPERNSVPVAMPMSHPLFLNQSAAAASFLGAGHPSAAAAAAAALSTMPSNRPVFPGVDLQSRLNALPNLGGTFPFPSLWSSQSSASHPSHRPGLNMTFPPSPWFNNAGNLLRTPMLDSPQVSFSTGNQRDALLQLQQQRQHQQLTALMQHQQQQQQQHLQHQQHLLSSQPSFPYRPMPEAGQQALQENGQQSDEGKGATSGRRA